MRFGQIGARLSRLIDARQVSADCDGPRIHRAGVPAGAMHRAGLGFLAEHPLMAAGLALSGMIGAATFAVTVMATPPPPDSDIAAQDTRPRAEAGLLPAPGVLPNGGQFAGHWDRAALGRDSDSQSDLLHRSYSVEAEIAAGDTLMSVLLDAGIDRSSAHEVVVALSDVFDPRRLKPGQTLAARVRPALPTEPAAIEELRFRPDGLRDIVVTWTEDGYAAEEDRRHVSDRTVRADGIIQSSLYIAARKAGVPIPVLGNLINVFSFDVDFQREIQPGDRFSLMFSETRTDEDITVGYGDILLAEMTVNGHLKRFYRFEDDTGRVDYYDKKGQSVRRALLRTPVEGARISSGYGKRKHPILGYTKVHKGLDFAAPSGTPIYAAGDGVVEAAGWNGGYGRYIRIRHNGTYKTAYAHLKRIDSRVKPGARVQQRQIIGYVGTSGRSTGPHLHYEVHVNGHHTNPLSVKLPTGKTLGGSELARFERVRAEIENQYAVVEPSTQVANAATE